MKIMLLNPPRYEGNIPVIREDRCEVTDRYSVIPPYSLLCMASLLREKGHDVCLVDANGMNIDYQTVKSKIDEYQPEVVIFRFTPTTFKWDMRSAEIVKARSSDIVTVGICLTLHTLGEMVLNRVPDLDYYLPLDWEEVLLPLVERIINDGSKTIEGVYYRQERSIVFNPISNKHVDSWELPVPAYDMLPDFSIYRPNAPTSGHYMVLYSSKGCPFSCTYCTVSGTPFKLKSTDDLIEELRTLYNQYDVRLVSFFDETFTMKKTRVLELCTRIREEMPELNWYCNTRVNLVDEETLSAMKRGGCRGTSFGIESGSQKILDNVKKGITVEESANAIKMAKDAGLLVYCSFIFGLPGETQETAEETIDFVGRTLPNSAQFNVAVPYPGTEFFEYAKENNLMSDNTTWEDLLQHKATVRTQALSQMELENIRKKAYRSMYLNPKWVWQNFTWVLKNRDYITMGIRYYTKALKNLLIHNMEHAH